MATAGIDMFQVDSITKEYPAPSQCYTLSIVVAKRIQLVRVRILQHHCIIEMLVFYVRGVSGIEFSEKSGEYITQPMEKCFSMPSTHETVRAIMTKHRGIEECPDKRRIGKDGHALTGRGRHGSLHLCGPNRLQREGCKHTYHPKKSLHHILQFSITTSYQSEYCILSPINSSTTPYQGPN